MANFPIHWFLVAGGWYLLNGVLHDVFVVRAHKGPYNRDLLRLLMDGHVLILSGLVMLVCWQMARMNIVQGPVVGLIIAAGMIAYCLMIFPFLKSFATMGISLVLVVACLTLIINFKSQT